MDNKSDRPIFIVGCERSGTTLLRLILHSHPNIAIPPQTKFLKKLYKRRILFGNLSKEKNKQKLAQWIMDRFNKKTKLNDIGLKPLKVRDGILESPPTFGSVVAVVFKLYSEKFGKTRWGDKRPYFIKYLPQLLSLFPRAQIIHVIRDGRDCMASLFEMPWWEKDIGNTIFNWQEAIYNGIKAKKSLPIDQYFELRYEDLIENPEFWVKKVCEFLNEDYTPAMLEFQKISEVAVPDYKMRWHYATREKISSQSIGRWKKDLKAWEINLFEIIAGKELSTCGYNLSSIKTSIPLSKWFELLISYFQYQSMKYFIRIIDRLIQMIYPWRIDYISRIDTN